MGYESRLIRVEDVDPEVAAAWDALPAARGRQADFLDSHAWHGEDSAPVREVVLVRAGPERVEELVGAVAAAVGMPLQLDLPCGDRPAGRLRPVPVHQALLPWPGSSW